MATFLLGHRADDRDHALDRLVANLALHVARHGHSAWQLLEHRGHAAHVDHLFKLILHVVEIEALALEDFLRELLRLS